MEKILFSPEDGEELEFFVLEQVRINGRNYLLVTDSEEEEAQAWILKDASAEEETEARYEFVEEDEELLAVARVFEEELEDVRFE